MTEGRVRCLRLTFRNPSTPAIPPSFSSSSEMPSQSSSPSPASSSISGSASARLSRFVVNFFPGRRRFSFFFPTRASASWTLARSWLCRIVRLSFLLTLKPSLESKPKAVSAERLPAAGPVCVSAGDSLASGRRSAGAAVLWAEGGGGGAYLPRGSLAREARARRAVRFRTGAIVCRECALGD
ncbi:hypothetical protein KC331_g15 [Hortaea werneckii]|nr:hypothetical protein KC331_g15 [Hortaea werneckii]